MSYVKAECILPQELFELVQEYAGGKYLYIPQKATNRKSWGENTEAKLKVQIRDQEIYQKYRSGTSTARLSEEYFLSLKSIQRIVLKEKRRNI